jgi:hypothetical protein
LILLQPDLDKNYAAVKSASADWPFDQDSIKIDCAVGDSLLSLSAVKRLKTIVVLLMLALWMPATSHALLESAGVIHQEHADTDSDGDHDHDAADGLVLLPSSANAPVTSAALVCVLPVVVFLLPEPVETRLMDRIDSGTSPPLPNVWQFVHRAALPARAPSFAS